MINGAPPIALARKTDRMAFLGIGKNASNGSAITIRATTTHKAVMGHSVRLPVGTRQRSEPRPNVYRIFMPALFCSYGAIMGLYGFGYRPFVPTGQFQGCFLVANLYPASNANNLTVVVAQWHSNASMAPAYVDMTNFWCGSAMFT